MTRGDGNQINIVDIYREAGLENQKIDKSDRIFVNTQVATSNNAEGDKETTLMQQKVSSKGLLLLLNGNGDTSGLGNTITNQDRLAQSLKGD